MIEYIRTNINDKYFAIQIFECPIEIIVFTARFGSKNVTIENFRNSKSLSFLVNDGSVLVEPKIKQLLADFQISQTDFISLKDIWNSYGCYAVFHDSLDLKFKASDLVEFARYKALENFGWTIEIAVPNSASDGWGQIVSPYQEKIDKIESYIQSLK